MAAGRAKGMKYLFRGLLYLAVAWLLGFGYFYLTLPEEPAEMPGADAIVVLTGGAGRLEAGLRLLEPRSPSACWSRA